MTTTTITIRRIGGPTALVELGGLRLLTDPTFDGPGDYPIGTRTLTKLAGPRESPSDVGPVDAVLLSHDQHPDNLDHGGRVFLDTAPLVLSTPAASGRLGARITPLEPWEHHELALPAGGILRVTAVPALHGPEGSESLVGEVTGFVLEAESLPTVYISGDNASLRLVGEIAERFPAIDVAVLFGGRARTALLGEANLTLDAAGLVAATRLLGHPRVVPVHIEGWAHFSQPADEVEREFAAAGLSNLLWR